MKLICSSGTIYQTKDTIEISTSIVHKKPGVFVKIGEFQAYGANQPEATLKVADELDQLIKTHVRKPPHLVTEEDQEVINRLYEVIDFDKFWIDNPIELPLMGKIIRKFKNGSLLVDWTLAPDEAGVDRLDVENVHPALNQMPIDSYFYASGKFYSETNQLEWTDEPKIIPDPYDEKVIREAWDKIPKVYANTPNVWPLKNEE